MLTKTIVRGCSRIIFGLNFSHYFLYDDGRDDGREPTKGADSYSPDPTPLLMF
ncbi:hypothetical protein [Actinotignum urinale]|uniref:hypothetical protein n=1 Tax=Actinotignum urinale TaxID=190146 RepID=UPI0003F6A91F|nr:hypothetical protein [Actinotignum urinale]MDY5159586.1 hypothetical protein [Actinotignum urinale]